MTEGTYEYECMRAELLGVDKPDYEEFLARRKDEEARGAEDEAVETENLVVMAFPCFSRVSHAFSSDRRRPERRAEDRRRQDGRTEPTPLLDPKED